MARFPDEADGRSSLVGLTERGTRVADEIIERHAANEIRLLSGLSQRQQADLARLLRELLLTHDDRHPATRSPSLGSARGSRRRTGGAASNDDAVAGADAT